MLCVIAGTWGINEFIWDSALVSPEILLTSVYCLDGYYLVTDGSMTSASNLEWYVKECFAAQGGGNAYKQADALVEDDRTGRQRGHIPALFVRHEYRRGCERLLSWSCGMAYQSAPAGAPCSKALCSRIARTLTGC